MSLRQKGFTLIEVMVALVVISIGLGALLVASSENIRTYQKLQDRMIENWVSIQVVNLISLKMVPLSLTQPYYAVTTVRNRRCYWKLQVFSTNNKNVYRIDILSKMHRSGPYEYHITTYQPLGLAS